MEIVMWADLQCPFCLVGEADLMNAIRELGIEDQVRLDIKTYEVHRPEDGEGDQQMAQIFQNKEGFTHDGAIRHIAAINAMEKEEAGYDIDFGKVRESTDFDAHRLYKFAMDHGKGQIVRDLLHKAYFKDCKVLADRKVLLEAAKEAGLDLAETEKMLDSDLYKREVRNDEMEFRARH